MFLRRRVYRICSAQVFVAIVCGQTTPTFDAAVIKKAESQEFSSGADKKMAKRAGRIQRPGGGPGTSDPGRIHYPSSSLRDLIKSAWSVKEYELAGPKWMEAAWFALDATMPPSTTKEQFRFMLQNLLAERFGLRVRRETREILTYYLAVAKNGPKLGRGDSTHATAWGADGAPVTLADQLMEGPGPAAGSSRWTGLRTTMNDPASKLGEETQRPVTDATGLEGKYDFTLTFRRYGTELGVDTDALPDIFAALRSIGLRLEAAKRPIAIVVVDHAEKTPTQN